MKTGWVMWDDVTPGTQNASSRIRCRWVDKYMGDSIISNNFKELSSCDAVIFQKRCSPEDVMWAWELKRMGKIIILDITDPEWNYRYQHYNSKKAEQLTKLIELCDCTVAPTDYLAGDFKVYFPGALIRVIPDRIDMELYKKVKQHKQHEGPFKVFWHGCHSNTNQVELARASLEELGQKYPMELTCCYGPIMDNKIKPFRNLELIQIQWSQEKCTELLVNSDVAINPRWQDLRAYKSDNKTMAALACGIPCADRDYQQKLSAWFESAEIRNDLGHSGRMSVENLFDVKQSAVEYSKLVESLANSAKREIPRVAVVSCITGSVDNVLMDQNAAGADFFMFTEKLPLSVPPNCPWTFIQTDNRFIDARRESRTVKWLIHKYFPEYDYTLWLDGNIILLTPVRKLIDQFLATADIAVFKHKDRDCVYKEADDCVSKQLDRADTIRAQMNVYLKEGYPAGNGLSELPAVLQRHTLEVNRFNEAVFAEYCVRSRRDQLCFDYVAWKQNIKVARFPGKVTRKDLNLHFEKIQHVKDDRRV